MVVNFILSQTSPGVKALVVVTDISRSLVVEGSDALTADWSYGESRRVEGADFRDTFQYLVFHTPFGGMSKGAHRTMMRKLATATRSEIEVDFEQRVLPGLTYCQREGNIMAATLFLALAATIDHTPFEVPLRIGCFSYGSGCCSEFYSGVVTPNSRESLRRSRSKSD